MSCCCSKYYNFCKVRVCDFLRTGIDAEISGIYVMILDFLGAELRIGAAIEEDSEIIFPTSGLNEFFAYTGKIVGPDGEQIEFEKDDETFDCIQFETTSKVNLNDLDITPPDIDATFNFLQSLEFPAPTDGNTFDLSAYGLAGKYLVSVEMVDQNHNRDIVSLDVDGILDLTNVGGATAGTLITVFYKNHA